MKSRQKITRVLLESEERKNFSLFGIVSAEPDYRLSLSINSAFRISLRNDKPVEPPGGSSFSRFSCHTAVDDISWNLISNKSGENFLVGKLNKIDYFLQLFPNDSHLDITSVSTTLRKIDTITAIFQINPDNIKDKNIHYLIP
ncbi:MAG TPA: IPExxxVDY family protein [Bacteroidales bacterium]|nr:IPExxxVDY family protein [Bacteroidales bacterium]